MCFSHKRVTKIVIERNELLRAAFKCHFAKLINNLDMLLCTDESSKDDWTVSHQGGYAWLGKHCPVCAQFIWGRRYSILPVLSIKGYIAYEVFDGPVMQEQFISFLCEHIVSSTVTSLIIH